MTNAEIQAMIEKDTLGNWDAIQKAMREPITSEVEGAINAVFEAKTDAERYAAAVKLEEVQAAELHASEARALESFRGDARIRAGTKGGRG